MISRRDLFAGAIAAGATLPLAGCVSSNLKNAGREDACLGRMLERHAEALRELGGGVDSLATTRCWRVALARVRPTPFAWQSLRVKRAVSKWDSSR